MASPPFKVKASYEYKSTHEDDLNFSVGQIITVTEEEDDDWYIGQYTEASGETKSGLFPKNFVERYEPAPPPRPARTARPKPAEAPPPSQIEEPSEPEPQAAAPIAAEKSVEEIPALSTPAEKSGTQEQPPSAPKPTSAAPKSGKGPPPPVAEKSSSFRDRIAAFNKPAAAPIAPFKPSSSATSTFIKKPFVAPPPARDSYVPPPREPAPQKVYKREEDPEIAERRAQDQEDAERAGLAPADGQEEEEVKTVSLKDRIALLQKQQMEQAARRAEHVHKKKPERPQKKRTGSYDREENVPRDNADVEAADVTTRDSSDTTPLDGARAPVRRPSRGPKSPIITSNDRELFSDGNDADQSAAGETEDAGASTLDEDEDASKSRQQAAAVQPPQEDEIGDEEDATEEEEMDEETRRQIALRERMAKLSGGMGMAGMFGPQPGIAMPGMAGGLKKKRPTLEAKPTDDTEPVPASPPPRIPMIPIPGMGGVIRSNITAEPEAEEVDEEEEETEAAPDAGDMKPTPHGREHTTDRTIPILTRGTYPEESFDSNVDNIADDFIDSSVADISLSERPTAPEGKKYQFVLKSDLTQDIHRSRSPNEHCCALTQSRF